VIGGSKGKSNDSTTIERSS
jgi:hypothetical protein